MHDPMTVAHEIRYPWRRRSGYRDPFITIWHKDPQKSRGRVISRSDDTCGWFTPPYTPADRDRILLLSRAQYPSIFAKQAALRERKSYASICMDQTTYGAVYWSWRAIKYADKNGWQYGDRNSPLTQRELTKIYELSSNPVDSIDLVVRQVTDQESFDRFFSIVWDAYRRLHRPWYKHPRWHIHHWQVQLHPWQNLKRRFWDKCCWCGKRGFKPGDSAMGNWSGTKIWHSSCDNAVVNLTIPIDTASETNSQTQPSAPAPAR